MRSVCKKVLWMAIALVLVLAPVRPVPVCADGVANGEIFYLSADGTVTSADPDGMPLKARVTGFGSVQVSPVGRDLSACGDAVVLPSAVSYKGVSLSVTSIDGFDNTYGLESLVLPDSLTQLSAGSFAHSCLESVTLPSSLRVLPTEAFAYCDYLKNVVVPSALEAIWDGAFLGCRYLNNVVLPASLRSIGQNAFSGCGDLSQITLPAGVESIGKEAFNGCSLLRTVTVLGAEPASLGAGAFDACNRLRIIVPADSLSLYETAWADYADRIVAAYPLRYTVSGAEGGGVSFSVDANTVTTAFNGALVFAKAVPVEGYTAVLSSADVTLNENGSFTMPDREVTVQVTYKLPPAAVNAQTGVEYDTVGAALQDAGNGETVKMLRDSTENAMLNTARSVTLDLNGFVLSGPGSGRPLTVDGSGSRLILKDSRPNEEHHIDGEPVCGGIITGGRAFNGGGIYVSTRSSLIMHGGTVIGNTASGDGGGIFWEGGKGETLVMYGGAITGNTAGRYGGGVLLQGGGKVVLNDGFICGNAAETGGGIYGGVTGSIEVNGGEITGNEADNTGKPNENGAPACGGGIFAADNVTLTVTGGSISGNTAGSMGGGVYVTGALTMTGGEIRGNEAALGGGICAVESVFAGQLVEHTMELSGGTVSGNRASENGGGLYGLGHMEVSVGGTAKVTGNTLADASANDAALLAGETVTVRDPAEGMSVGILMEVPGVFTENAAEGSIGCFFSDDPAFAVRYDADSRLTLMPLFPVTVEAPEHGTLTADVSDACEGDTVTLTAAPHTGYELKSLSAMDASGNDVAVADASFVMPAAGVTVSAAFAPLSYEITCLDEGGEPFSGILPDGFPAAHTYGTDTALPGASREGCVFDGWFTGPDCEGSAITVLGAEGFTGDITLYARWTHLYTIIYGADSVWTKGSGIGCLFTSDAPYAKLESVAVDGNTLTPAHYTAEDGSTKVTLSAAYLETLSPGSHTLTVVSSDGSASAAFTVKEAPLPETFTVTFESSHGTAPAAQTVEAGKTAEKPEDPAEDGWVFEGWFADAEGKTPFSFDTPITADVTVYAGWSEKPASGPDAPETGDSSALALWAVLFAASLAALACALVRAAKRRA